MLAALMALAVSWMLVSLIAIGWSNSVGPTFGLMIAYWFVNVSFFLLVLFAAAMACVVAIQGGRHSTQARVWIPVLVLGAALMIVGAVAIGVVTDFGMSIGPSSLSNVLGVGLQGVLLASIAALIVAPLPMAVSLIRSGALQPSPSAVTPRALLVAITAVLLAVSMQIVANATNFFSFWSDVAMDLALVLSTIGTGIMAIHFIIVLVVASRLARAVSRRLAGCRAACSGE